MVINLEGKQYGRWTVLEKMSEKRNGTTHYRCKCSCGKTKIVAGNNLSFGKSKSCGCLRNSLRKSQNWQVQLNLRPKTKE
jgi:hypothetical protein